jgi:hypothetical protein
LTSIIPTLHLFKNWYFLISCRFSLKEKYTVDGERLIQPERQARFLGIDEFKLHDGHKYAVIIIDMETGHIL